MFWLTCCLLKGPAASVRTAKVLNQHASRTPELPLCVFTAARITFVEAVFNPGEVFTTFTVRFLSHPLRSPYLDLIGPLAQCSRHHILLLKTPSRHVSTDVH